MVLTPTSVTYATPKDSAKTDYEVLEEQIKENDAIVEDGKVRVSIVLEENSTIGKGYGLRKIGKNSKAKAYRKQLQKKQEKIVKTISKKVLGGQELEVVWNITLAGNMISAWVPVDKISEISEIDGVSEVIVETKYDAPKPAKPDKPNMTVAVDMTDSSSVWSKGVDGYTGAGSQIAIIDTGLDTDHQSFSNDAFMHSIDELKGAGRNVTLMTKSDVEAVWDQLNAYKRSDEGKKYTVDQMYYSEKVPFGFNYVDETTEITHDNDDQSDHGSHVSGIAAANRYVKDENGNYVDALDSVLTQGQAPDAQIVVMKVFGTTGGAYDSDYMVAIEDAVILGCESINLSLGSTQPGFAQDVTGSSKRYNAIFDELANSDSVVTIAAGNSYNWASNAVTNGKIYSDDVNFDMVGKPGSYKNSLAVASVNNNGMTGYYTTAYDHNIFYTESKHKNEPIRNLARKEAYDYIYIDGTATTEQIADLGDIIKDKVVICQRGDITFVEKAENIANAGGIATIIANNTVGTIALDLSEYKYTQPVVAITQEEGNFLRDHGTKEIAGSVTYYTGEITINNTIGNFHYKKETYEMSDFSSWGIPSSLTLKPEITAPGGNIYSIDGKNTDAKSYRNGSGTSMATPQVAGITAVIYQYIKENGLDTFAKEQGLTIRGLEQSLLMGTASPLKEESGKYYSLLRQGAGLVNLGDATRAKTFIVMDESATNSAKDGKVKAEIGDDPERKGEYNVKFKIYNIDSEQKSLDLSAEFFTQQYVGDKTTYMDGSTTKLPSEVTWKVNGKSSNSAVVSAKGSVDVQATIKVKMPEKLDDKGNYIEGYLFAKEAASKEGEEGVTQSIPVLGYYGSWTEPSMYDKGDETSYSYGLETRAPYTVDDSKNITNSIKYYVTSSTVGNDVKILGQNPYILDENYHPERAAITNKDKISVIKYALIRNAAAGRFIVVDDKGQTYFERNLKNAQYAAYYNSSSTEEVKWENSPTDLYVNKDSNKFTGTTLSKVPEGAKLTFSFESAPEYYQNEDGTINWDQLGDGAKIAVTAVMDNTVPELVVAKAVKDKSGKITGIRVVTKDNNYIAGVQLLQGAFMNLERIGAPEEEVAGGEVEFTFKALKEGVDDYTIAIYDYAGNKTSKEIKLSQLSSDEGESPKPDDETKHEHTYDQGVVTKEATCTEDGIMTFTCVKGDDSYTEVIKATGHTEEIDSAKEATCKETGLTEGSHCSVCHEVLKAQKEIPLVDHTWDEGMVTKEATYKETGVKTYTCTVCGEEKTEEIPVILHEEHVYGSWTSNYVNNTIHRECILCGEREEVKNPFNDVTDNAFYVPIVWAYHTELTTGVNETTFLTNGDCTRGQVVTFLWRIVGKPEPKTTTNPFSDVSENSPYYKAILWAAENEITTGTSTNKFSPSATCTRGQVVTFLWRMAGKPEPKTVENPFGDVSKNSPYYKAILWASENGIATGTSAKKFNPSATCTRAQVVTFLYRYDTDYLVKLGNK
ncbi:hypothetical protein P261_01230 [Lachnospiraceae bacterium TWA4]|nr:hypothetical protein P261_01230 [Lachnospiraceae bacterium TWA4]